jgi:hypothetical protein
MLFFEKDPKTFPRAQRGCATTCAARRSTVERERQRRETLGTMAKLRAKRPGTFFGSFFQKRTAFFRFLA